MGFALIRFTKKVFPQLYDTSRWKRNFNFFSFIFYTSMLHLCDSSVWNVLNFIKKRKEKNKQTVLYLER